MKIRKISKRSSASGSNVTISDKFLIKNVVNNLATSLQDLTTYFRKNQNLYLKSIIFSDTFKEIQARKERSNMLYDTSQYSTSSALMTEEVYDYDEDDNVMINYYVGIITIRMKTFLQRAAKFLDKYL